MCIRDSITPYRSQIALIRKELQALAIPALSRISIDTVERYQGSERAVSYTHLKRFPQKD